MGRLVVLHPQPAKERLPRHETPWTDIVVLNIGDARGNDVMLQLRATGIAVYRITRMHQGIVDRSDLHVEQMHDKKTGASRVAPSAIVGAGSVLLLLISYCGSSVLAWCVEPLTSNLRVCTG